MREFDAQKTKYILNIGRGTLHYYNTQRCHSSKMFDSKDTNLKFYNTENEVIKDNQSHFRKCKFCFKDR